MLDLINMKIMELAEDSFVNKELAECFLGLIYTAEFKRRKAYLTSALLFLYPARDMRGQLC